MRSRAAAGLVITGLVGVLMGTRHAAAQTPDRPDETDFEGRSSVLLGSGARALGMGGAFLARADDATAASWNPAGLSYLRAPEVSAVWGRNEQSRHDPDVGILGDSFAGTGADFLALAYPIEIGSALGAAQVSYQRVFSFSGERNIERFGTDAQRINLRLDGNGGFDVVALGSGLQLTRQWRAGATLNRWFNGYDQFRVRQTQGRVLEEEIDFDFAGWNANLGIIFSPRDNLNLGAVYKTGFTGDASMRRHRVDDFVPSSPQTRTENAFASDDLRVEFPAAVGLGASWRPISTLTLSADWTRTFWSEGRIREYFIINARPPGGVPPAPEVFPELLYPTLDDPVQHDTTQIRVGAEYVILRGRLRWPLRAGYFSDWQYFEEVGGGAPRYDGFTAGTGVILGPVLLDVAYVTESGSWFEPDDTPHRVSTRFHRVLVSVIYRHVR